MTHLIHASTEMGWRGGERQVLLIADGLRTAGLSQSIAAPPGSELARRAHAAGHELLPLPANPVLHPFMLLGLAIGLRRRDPVLIHSHTSKALTAALFLRRLARVRGVVHSRRVAFPLRKGFKYRDAADAYIAVSQAVAQQFQAIGTPSERLSVIPDAADPSPIDRASPAESPFPGAPLVVCVAQFTAEKGVATLCRAWEKVIARHPMAGLVVIGDGPERAAIAAALGPVADRVRMLGFRNDVPSWIKIATVYVQPSLHEGLGSTAIDALLAGVPVVASRTGGLPEVLDDGRAGMLVKPGDAADLASALCALLSDPSRRAELSAAGREHARARFAPATVIASHLALYRRLGVASPVA